MKGAPPQDALALPQPQDAPARARVLLPLPLGAAYDYAVPPALALEAGDFVAVPLGPREVIGVVWDTDPPPPPPKARLKPIRARLPAPPMTPSLRQFVDWVAQYTLSPPGAVLRMAMSVPAALEPPAAQPGWMLAPPGGKSTIFG